MKWDVYSYKNKINFKNKERFSLNLKLYNDMMIEVLNLNVKPKKKIIIKNIPTGNYKLIITSNKDINNQEIKEIRITASNEEKRKRIKNTIFNFGLDILDDIIELIIEIIT